MTGKQGYRSLEKIAELVSEKLTQKQIEDDNQPKKIKPKDIIFGCTGTIGETFPEEKIINKVPVKHHISVLCFKNSRTVNDHLQILNRVKVL